MTLVILAAGIGSRYGGMKQIDPMNDDGDFIIDFSIYDAIKCGFDKVVFVIKEENLHDFKETIGNRINQHINVEYAFQKLQNVPEWFVLPENRAKPWGTTHAIMSVYGIVNEPFAVINSDDFYGREAFEILYNHLSKSDKINEKAQFCMVAYKLKNTITEHGAVNRGICNVDARNHLKNIIETREIVSIGNGMAEYPDGTEKRTLNLDSVVSMNCWGFTPDIFPYLSIQFEKFLKNIKDPIKDESYLTDVIDGMIKNNACDVSVYNTNASWLGITYQEDKPKVVSGIKKLIDSGVYPKHLWK